jgi:quinol monooxygenase YgiN
MIVKKGLLARIKAKPGKEADVEKFLKSALPLAEAEELTVDWFAFKIDDSTFGIYDTFEGEEGQTAHLEGKIASALMAKADELLASDPVIEKIDVLASK